MSNLFPHPDTIEVDGHYYTPEEIIHELSPWLTEHRKRRIDEVILNRTYSLTPVLEGLYDVGNMNAVLRTAEGLGIQSVHIIETSAKYKEANRVTQGSEKWLDIFRWKSTTECLDYLKGRGYRIFVTILEHSRRIEEVDFTQPSAIVLGNEHAGVSPEAVQWADECISIPMYGFTQSFNISVATAIILYHALNQRKAILGQQGDLTEKERQILKARYYLKSVSHATQLLTGSTQKKSETRSTQPK